MQGVPGQRERLPHPPRLLPCAGRQAEQSADQVNSGDACLFFFEIKVTPVKYILVMEYVCICILLCVCANVQTE
jgi:hypothetical protein